MVMNGSCGACNCARSGLESPNAKSAPEEGEYTDPENSPFAMADGEGDGFPRCGPNRLVVHRYPLRTSDGEGADWRETVG